MEHQKAADRPLYMLQCFSFRVVTIARPGHLLVGVRCERGVHVLCRTLHRLHRPSDENGGRGALSLPFHFRLPNKGLSSSEKEELENDRRY